MNTLSIVVAAGFVLLSLFIAYISIRQLKLCVARAKLSEHLHQKILSRSLGLLITWFILISGLALTGFTQRADWFPFNLILIVVPPVIAAFILVFSQTGGVLLKHIPLSGLTYLQSFRVVVEVLLWMLFLNEKLPVHMTFEGKNYDILAGLTAPVVALTLSKNKIVMILWNLFSMALLLNIFITGILSAPTPIQQFFAEPGSALLMKFPFILLPAFLVPMALLVHLLSLRKLFGNGHLQDS